MDKKKKIKILFLRSWYPGKLFPTLGNFCQKHAESVSGLAEINVLYACGDPNQKSTYILEKNEERGVHVTRVYYARSSGWFLLSDLLNMIRYFSALKLGFKSIYGTTEKPDVVHHNIIYPAGMFARYLKRKHKIPYLITENWTGYLLENSGAYRGLFRKWATGKICKEADLLTPVTKNLEKALKSHNLGKKFRVIYNVTDTGIFKPGSPDSGEPVTFIHVSTLKEDHKNISGIIRVAHRLDGKGLPFRIRVIHDESNQTALNVIKELNVNPRIFEFLGSREPEGVSREMAKCHAFLLFSNYENLPCVMVEAMACGLPVIATDVGGISEHLKPEFGFLIAPRDEEALEASMEAIIKGKEFNSDEIRKYAVENFSYEAIGQKFFSIYKELSGKK
jgi:glycosyltransferase involved in cell wall biosynthesis